MKIQFHKPTFSDFAEPPEFVFPGQEMLEVGDEWQEGDKYGVSYVFTVSSGVQKFAVGSLRIKPGDRVTEDQLSRYPRRAV